MYTETTPNGKLSTPAAARTNLRKRLPAQTTADTPSCAPPAYKQISRYTSVSRRLVTASSPVYQRTHKEQPIALGAHVGEMQLTNQQRTHTAILQITVHAAASRQPVTPTLSVALPVSFRAVSRPLELSLQSSLQLSFTVLVCYRSHGHI